MLRVSDKKYFQKEVANLQSYTPNVNYPHTKFGTEIRANAHLWNCNLQQFYNIYILSNFFVVNPITDECQYWTICLVNP